MSFTTRFHSKIPADITTWKALNPGAIHAKYKKFEEPLSPSLCFKITLLIVIKSIATLGVYYFVYLQCTKVGKKDLENLKRRTFVHYVANDYKDKKIPAEAKKTKDSAHLISKESFEKHHELLERNLQRAKNEPNYDQARLSNNLKSCVEEVYGYRKICKDVNEIIKAKRLYFLDHLHEKNEKLSSALEKFFYEEKQDSYHFIKLVGPFLKDTELTGILKQALQMAADMQLEKKTLYHQKFEEFHRAYNSLLVKSDWIISINANHDLLSFVHDMITLGEYYSPRFKNLYEKNSQLFEACLDSMKGSFDVDQEGKNAVNESFQNWKNLSNKLYHNLAFDLAVKTFSVYYSLAYHLDKELYDLGLDEGVQSAIAANELSVDFIVLFFSGKIEKVFHGIQPLINDNNIKKEALDECLKKIKDAESAEKEALKKVQSEECKTAFKKMMDFFIEQQDFNDAVYTLVEAELMFQIQHPKEMDQEFFNFFKKLKQSEFFIKGREARCNHVFYLDFKDYFKKIDLIVTQLIHIFQGRQR